MKPDDVPALDPIGTAELLAARRRYHHPDLDLLAAELGLLEEQLDAVLRLISSGRRRLARLLREDPHHPLKGWCLALRLLEESERTTPNQPDRGAQLAELARHMAAALHPQRYGAAHLAELTALAWAHEGNALRVKGQLPEAAPCFAAAEEQLAAADAQEPGLRARTLALLASYQLYQRQLPEAETTTATARSLAREAQDETLEGVLCLQHAAVASELGRLAEAQEACREALALLPAGRKPRWRAQAHHNLANCLARAGSFPEALAELEQCRPLLTYVSNAEKVRVDWLEGVICRGLAQHKQAIHLMRRARSGFFELHRPYEAALVTLELAMVLLEAGHPGAARLLAIEAYPMFKSRNVGREALAALVLVRDAAKRNTLTVDLLQQAREQAEG